MVLFWYCFGTVFQILGNFRHISRSCKSHKRPLYKGFSHIIANIITDFYGTILVQFRYHFGIAPVHFYGSFILIPDQSKIKNLITRRRKLKGNQHVIFSLSRFLVFPFAWPQINCLTSL